MKKLMNLKRQMRVFNLDHPAFLLIEGDHPVGKPETLTLLAREVREVPDEALLCREIRGALNPRKGRPTLRVLD